MNIWTMDFETYWSSKNYTLSKMGPIEYVRDKRFAVQLLGLAKNNQPVDVVDRPKSLDDINWADDVVVGHNMSGFDALILSEFYKVKPQHIWDTISMMRWAGLSSVMRENLASLAKALGIGTKKAGTVVSDSACWPDEFLPEEREFFKQYCKDDVQQCREAMRIMLPSLSADALRFMSITARMATEPVFVLDTAMLEDYLKQLDKEAEEARQEIMKLFHFYTVEEMLKAIRSKDKFADMLYSLGVEPPRKVSEAKSTTAGKTVMEFAFSKTDTDFLDLQEHPDYRVRLLVEKRLQFNSSILRTRCETLLKFARMNKPLPVMLSAFKAHTGRYSAGANGAHSSDGIQIQNLSKRNPLHRVLRQAIQVPKGYSIVACDSSQIEARVLAWAANQHDLLGHFKEGRDPYAEFGTNLLEPNEHYTARDIHDGAKSGDKRCKFIRNLSKQFILSCGYGSGKDKVASTLWAQGVRLSQYRDEHNEIAARHLQTYRTHHAAITAFWRTCGKVIEAMAAGKSGQFGGPDNTTFTYKPVVIPGYNTAMVMSVYMPNGYALRYPGLRFDEDRQEYVYDKWLGKNRVSVRLYSSLLTENCIQSLSFMALMWQACRMDEAGIKLKCNIHDAWATVVKDEEAEETAQRMLYYMKQVPLWLAGCPLNAEAEIGKDFTIV